MAQKLALLLFLVCLGCQSAHKASPSAPPKPTIAYIIEPAQFEKTPALKVTVAFAANSTGQTVFVLPEKWASENDYYKDVRSLKLLTPGATLIDGPEPFLRVIGSPANVRLTVSYLIVPGVSHGTNPARALITGEYFHVVGYNLFAFPDLPQDRPITIDLSWRNFPPGFAFANSYGAKTVHQEFKANIGQLKDAIYVGGDFRIHEEPVDHSPVFIAVRGKWQFSDDELIGSIRKVIKAERDFWNDHDFPYFLITLIPNGKECCTNGGTGFNQSFATYLAANSKIDHHLMWIYAHELFHTWNGWKIGHQEPQPLVFWFSEGFTNYYARLLSLRAGFMNLRQYVQDYNEAIYRYNFSPAKNAPNERILKDFWSDEAVGKLPYQRGDLLALHWNWRLKTETGLSLDQPMRDLLEEAQAKGTVVSAAIWDRLLSRYLKQGISDELARFIDTGEAIVPDAQALGPCVKQEIREVGNFDLGFDRDVSIEKRRITGLKKDSAAYRAGLREGQVLVDREVADPPLRESRFKIQDARGSRWIQFPAEGQEKKAMPLYSLDEVRYKKDPASCMQWFGSL